MNTNKNEVKKKEDTRKMPYKANTKNTGKNVKLNNGLEKSDQSNNLKSKKYPIRHPEDDRGGQAAESNTIKSVYDLNFLNRRDWSSPNLQEDELEGRDRSYTKEN